MLIVLGFGCLLMGIIVLIQLGAALIHHRTRRIAASRAGETFDDFRAEFAGDGIPEDVLSAIHKKFQEWCADSVAAFPVRASDDIGAIYGIAEEDLDDLTWELLDDSGRTMPDLREHDRIRPIRTVRDLVLFVADCKAL